MEKDIITYRHKAQYYETDQMGVIHHSNYIRWFEEARVDLLDQIGFSYKHMEETGISIPVLGVSCEFKSMVRYGDIVLIIPKVEDFNGVKMTISYRITDEKTGVLRAFGNTKHCFLNVKSGRPLSLERFNKAIYDIFADLAGIAVK